MPKKREQKFILISAGGTGGHMSPAAALANDLKRRDYRVELATDPRGMKFVGMFDNVKTHTIKSGTAHAGLLGKIKGALNLGLGILQGIKLIKTTRPDLVVGFGGYPSVPAVYVAQKSDIPTVLHESNAVIGKANIFLAPEAERIALSLPYMQGLEKEDTLKCVITGNPIRSEISVLSEEPYPESDETLRIFIMGGSLGASILSKVIPEALSGLDEQHRAKLDIIQQAREEDIETVKETYQAAGIRSHIAPFFDDVAHQIKNANLFIGRSGASTVAEISAAGRPAIYIPLKVHADEQQKKNARLVSDHGGAWIIDQDDFNAETLRTKIEEFFSDPEILPEAAMRAKSCGKPDAARRLGNLIAALVEA